MTAAAIPIPNLPHQTPPGPLSAMHLEQLSSATRRARKVRRAAAVAACSGWSMLVFALLSLSLTVLSDSTPWTTWTMSLGLLLIALNELRGGGMIRRMDPAGANVLGWNQIVLAALLVAYATWSLAGALRSPPAPMNSGDPAIDALAAQITTSVSLALYGGMIVLGLLLPTLTALYYFTRARVVHIFLAQTPAWIIEIMRRS